MGVVDDIVVDPVCMLVCGTCGVHTFRPRGGPQRLILGWGHLSATTEVFVVSLRVGERSLVLEEVLAVDHRVGERVLAVVRWGVRLLGWYHLWRWIDIGHGAQARRHGCPFQAVISRTGGIAQGILVV